MIIIRFQLVKEALELAEASSCVARDIFTKWLILKMDSEQNRREYFVDDPLEWAIARNELLSLIKPSLSFLHVKVWKLPQAP